ncbi:glycosyltransferase [Thiocystis violacea]|uniref:glycosyltransferase n=1 Tax=Thiocystis violacea TaxID=13725 RepID=UPI001906BCC3|nr:glycosyltransferase [Thiocystis violacea]
MPNIFVGLLYKLLWGASVLVDIDEEELAFVDATEPLTLEHLLQLHGADLQSSTGCPWERLPAATQASQTIETARAVPSGRSHDATLGPLTGSIWTHLAVGLANSFDGLTVANRALQQCYGGTIVHHARDENRFQLCAQRRQRAREQLGIAQSQQVILLLGNPLQRRELLGTGHALASLDRPNVLFLIADSIPALPQSLHSGLRAIPGLRTHFLEVSCFENAPDLLASADIVLFMHEPASQTARFQTPSPLSDARVMGLTLLAEPTPDLADLVESGAVIPVTRDTLVPVLRQALDQAGAADAPEFLRQLSFEANRAVLKSLMDSRLRQRARRLAPELERLCASSLLGSFLRTLPRARTAHRDGVSIIILTLNGAALLARLLKTFFATNTHRPVELIIIDHDACGDPSDDTEAVIGRYRDQGDIWYIQRGANYSFSASCNLAADWARYPKLLFLNNDIIYTADALPIALRKLADPDIGIVGIRLDDDPDSLPPGQEPGIQHLGIEFPWSEQRGYHHPRQIRHPSLKAYLAQSVASRGSDSRSRSPAHSLAESNELEDRMGCGEEGAESIELSQGSGQPAVTGAFLLCRKRDFERLGGFSTDYDYGLEDIDFCLRMSRDRSKTSWCLTRIGLQHAESSTRKRDHKLTSERIERNHRRFKALWSAQVRELAARSTPHPEERSIASVAHLSSQVTSRKANTPSPPSHLNLLFVLPQALDSNSGYHVQLHAAQLQACGVDCRVVVPDVHHVESTTVLTDVLGACSYTQALTNGRTALFSDGRGPDLIHAWTPRECVRRFVEAFRERSPCPLLIHLEDNEEYLTEATLAHSFAELARLSLEDLDTRIPAHRYHPLRGRRFLDQADGLTLIVDTLERFNTRGVPSLVLSAPVDERLFHPRPQNRALRHQRGIPDDYCVLAYTGNVHAANKADVAELYRAVERLNQQGHPTVLLRTGLNGKGTEDAIVPSPHVHELGWVAREQVPEILAAADVLVQPGEPGAFNDQRIPSKLPEFFAMGRPVVLARSHVGRKVRHGQDAFILESSTAEAMAQAVRTLQRDARLREQLSSGAWHFHERRLRLSETPLLDFIQASVNSSIKPRGVDAWSRISQAPRSMVINTRLADLKDSHTGERCVLVANGPSLNRMDLSFLKREICIGMNKIYLGIKKFRFYPRYYVAVNLKVVNQAANEIKALTCRKFIGQGAAQDVLREDALTYLVRTHAYELDNNGIKRPGFCRDIAREGMHEGWTVTHAALQVAYYLGFTEVVIIGMDHRYEYSGNPNEACVLDGADPNHFSPDYFGGGQTWDNPDLAHSEESYRLARREYEKAGRRIIDATLDGACTVFEKGDYRAVFGLQG